MWPQATRAHEQRVGNGGGPRVAVQNPSTTYKVRGRRRGRRRCWWWWWWWWWWWYWWC